MADISNENSQRNTNKIAVFSKNNYQGINTTLKPGNYLVSELPNMKSIKIPDNMEVVFSSDEEFDNDKDFSYPTVEELKNNTSSEDDYKYKIDNINTSQYKHLYVLKVDLNNKDGIADHDEYDSDHDEYFGRHIKNMKELDNTEKEKLIEIAIDNSPEFQGLPDLTQYKNLKDIKLLFNVLKNKDENFIKGEYDKIINYIDKVNPLRVIEIQGTSQSYEKTQNNKFFGFNLENFPSISENIAEIHLINCKNLSNTDFSKYRNLQKIYMYGNTFESFDEIQWRTILKQLFKLSNQKQAKLTHLQLPRTFTGEIPMVGDTQNSSLQYLSALGATSVERDAFINSTQLIELNLPKVKRINQGAFYNNKSLKIVNIPEIEEIVQYAFQYCHSLTKVGDIKNISGNNGIFIPKVKTIGSCAFMSNNDAQNIIVTSIILPECETLENNVFMRYRKVQTISIPKCKQVGELAFYDPYNLREIEATSLETIGPRAFQYASVPMHSFKTVNGKKEVDNFLELPNCKVISDQAFFGDKPHNMRGTDTVKLPKATSVADNAFRAAHLQTLEAPNINNKSSILSDSSKFN